MLTVLLLPLVAAVVTVVRRIYVDTSMAVAQQNTVLTNTILMWRGLKFIPILQISSRRINEKPGVNVVFGKSVHGGMLLSEIRARIYFISDQLE